jgi:hypothetical protein
MPSVATVFNWKSKYPEFVEQYTRACEERAEYQFEEMQDIADDGRNDWMEMVNKKGENVGWKVNGEAVQRSKLRVETRKWAMAKMMPKRFGDRLQVDGNDPIKHDVTHKFAAASDEQLFELAAKFAAQNQQRTEDMDRQDSNT